MFWDKVKSELEYLGLTQKELSAKTGINIGTLKNQICRNVIPNAEDAYKIASVLNTSLEFLLSESDSQGFSSQEKNMINSFRTLSPAQKKIILMLLDNFNGISPEIQSDGSTFVLV